MITTEDMRIAIDRVVLAKKRNDAALKEMKTASKVLNDAVERLECCTRLRK